MTVRPWLEHLEAAAFGATWLEALVLAILVGTAVRTAWSPGRRWLPGITFSAKTLLEVAVLLLGVSISAGMILAAGPTLIAGIAGIVVAGHRRQLRPRPGACACRTAWRCWWPGCASVTRPCRCC